MSQGQLGLTSFILDSPGEVPQLPQQHGEAVAGVLAPVLVLGCGRWGGRTGKSRPRWENDKLEATPMALVGDTVSAESREKGPRENMKGLFSSILAPVLPLATQSHLHRSCPSTYSTSITVHLPGCLLASGTSQGQILLLQR